jgi:hypothetical protein
MFVCFIHSNIRKFTAVAYLIQTCTEYLKTYTFTNCIEGCLLSNGWRVIVHEWWANGGVNFVFCWTCYHSFESSIFLLLFYVTVTASRWRDLLCYYNFTITMKLGDILCYWKWWSMLINPINHMCFKLKRNN